MRLAKLRKEKGETQISLAKKVGVTGTAISNYETGLRMPKIKTLKRLANVLECTVDELIGDDDESERRAIPATDEKGIV